MQHFGVTPAGCMDIESFLIANALVKNSSREGVIEFAYQGPFLKLVNGETKISITDCNFNMQCFCLILQHPLHHLHHHI